MLATGIALHLHQILIIILQQMLMHQFVKHQALLKQYVNHPMNIMISKLIYQYPNPHLQPKKRRGRPKGAKKKRKKKLKFHQRPTRNYNNRKTMFLKIQIMQEVKQLEYVMLIINAMKGMKISKC